MWNLSTYDKAMLFIANEIDRVSMGNTTGGLITNPDGSFDVYIQHSRPDADRAANWQTPAATFNPTVRYYGPLSGVRH